MAGTTVSVFQIVGNPICVEADDGEKVYEKIKLFLLEKKEVALSFLNVTMLTSAFLNTAIGKLYGEFSEDEIETLIKIQDVPMDDIALLERAKKNAKLYYKDPTRIEKSIREILGD
jgi:Icc-related predicted phosphoesterase